MLFKFKKGLYPSPLLAINTNVDESFFSSLNYKEGSFIKENKHYFNISAYLIVDLDNQAVLAYAFNELVYLIWLLIFINKNTKIDFSKKLYLDNKELIDKYFVVI